MSEPAKNADAFDPYHKWLGIRPTERPITHYRLLGLSPFEDHPDVIVDAADRQMAHVRTYQTGKHSELSQQLLNELSTAKLCLLNKAKKEAYDKGLTAAERAAEAAQVPAARISAPQVSAAETLPASTAAEAPAAQGSGLPMPLMIGGAAAAAVAALGAILLFSFWPASTVPVASNSNPPSAPSGPPEPSTPATPTPVAPSTPTVAPQDIPSVPLRPAAPSNVPETPSAIVTPPVVSPPVVTPPTVTPPVAPVRPTPVPVTPPEISRPVEPSPVPQPVRPQPVGADPSTVSQPRKTAAKSPIPETAALTTTRKTVKEIFADDFKSRKTDERVALARKLIKESLGTRDDVVGRYVLLEEAFNAASDAGDVGVAWQAAEALDLHYEVDVVALKKNALADASRQTRTPAKTIAQMYQALVEQAVQLDDYDSASTLVTAGIAVARKAKDDDLTAALQARGKEVRDMRGEFAKVKAAREKLAASPDDADAALLVGKYLCLLQNQWQEGLALLGKGAEETYQTLAKLEAAQPSAVDARVSLGDAWWTEAEKDRTPFKSGLQRRAAHWYQLALPSSSGLVRSRIEKRIAESPKVALASSFSGIAPTEGPGSILPNVAQPAVRPGTPPGRNAPAVQLGPGNDRAAAEMAFRLNGNVSIYDPRGNSQYINNVNNLPAEFRLHSLTIQSIQSTDADLALLKGLTHLQSFSILNANQVTEQGLGVLADLTNLTQLTVFCPNLSDQGMAAFSRMTKLKYLNLSSPALSGRGLSELVAASALESVDFRGMNVSDEVFASLRLLPQVNRFGVHGERLTGAGLAELARTNLAHLQISGPSLSDSTCTALSRLTGLQSLDLNTVGVTDAGLAHLASMQQLKTLAVRGGSNQNGRQSTISDEGLMVIRHLPRLESLQMSYLPQFTGKALTAAPNTLRVFQVHNCPQFSDLGLKNLKSQTGLQNIHLSQVNVTDAGVAHLKGLQIMSLSIYESPVTDACLPTIASLSQLRSLNMNRTQVTPAALEDLRTSISARNNR